MEERAHVVPVVGHPHLWSNEQDFPVVEDDSDVIDDVLVGHGPTSPNPSEVSEEREEGREGRELRLTFQRRKRYLEQSPSR